MKNLSLLLLLMPGLALAQDTLHIDLKSAWLTHVDGKYIPHDGSGRIAYLPVQECQGEVIKIQSATTFDLYFNDRLINNSIKQFSVPISDLRRKAGDAGMIVLFSATGVRNIKCESIQILQQDAMLQKLPTVSNFMIIAAILLAGVFVSLLRTQPVLTLSYLNVPKIFSLRSSDETQNLRITSVNNLFFYLFSSALVALLLFVFDAGTQLVFTRFGTALISVIELMALLFSLLIAKALWIRIFAWLFNLRDFSSGQFQEYPKIWLISFGFCGLLLTILVMIGAAWPNWIRALEYFVVIVHLVFVCAVFLKLMARGGFTAFHLFSYLCATEIIPFILLVNIYFF